MNAQFFRNDVAEIHHKIASFSKKRSELSDILDSESNLATVATRHLKTHVFHIVPVFVGSALDVRQTIIPSSHETSSTLE